MAMTEEQIRETEFINEIAELTLSIYGVLTQECCSECERPKFPQGMQAGDETKVGWSACVNEKCVAYGEQKASACYRFSERASAEQSAEIQQLLAFHSRKVEQRTAAVSLQSREPVSELGEPRGTARHKPGCLWNETLPTGVGTWGCDCGLDLLLSQLEDFTLAEPSASGVVEASPQARKEHVEYDSAGYPHKVQAADVRAHEKLRCTHWMKATLRRNHAYDDSKAQCRDGRRCNRGGPFR